MQRRRLKHVICDLEERLALIAATVETERRRNTEARLEARLLEALLAARLAVKQLIETGGSDDDGMDRAAARQFGAGAPGRYAAFAAAPPSLPAAPARPPSFHPQPATMMGADATTTKIGMIRGGDCGAAAGATCGGQFATAPLSDGLEHLCPQLLQRLQAAMDGLIDDLHAAEQQGAAGCNSPPPPLAHRVRSSAMLANTLAVREQHFANARELYVWLLQRMGEASSALLDAGTPPRVGWGGGKTCCEENGGGNCDNSRAAAVETRLVQLVQITVTQLLGHFTFHPKTPGLLELLTMNLETWQPGGAGEELWAVWLEAMGISEQQEFLLLRLHHLFESGMAFQVESHKQQLMTLATSQPVPDAIEQSDTVDALVDANFKMSMCVVSTVIVAFGAVLTPGQVMRMYSVAAPQWLPGPTGLLDAVARRAAQRRQHPRC